MKVNITVAIYKQYRNRNKINLATMEIKVLWLLNTNI